MGNLYLSGEDAEVGDVVECVEDKDTPFDVSVRHGSRYVVVRHDYHHVWLEGQSWGFWKSRFKLISRKEKSVPCINYPTPATRRFDEIPIGRLFCFVSPQDQVVRKKMSMHTYVNLFAEGRADFSATLDECRPDRQVYCLVTTSPPEFTASTTI